MANEDGQPPDKITEAELRTMCMVQLLFKRKCMLYADLKAACKEIMKSDSEATVTSLLADIGELLQPLRMQVKSFTHFNDGKKYVALINLIDDAASKLSSKYSFAQLQFFNHLLEKIAMSPSEEAGVCSITTTSALNIDIAMATQMTQVTQEQLAGVRLTVGEKEKTLHQLQDEMWLGETEDGKGVTIGPRSFLELKSHLLALDLPEETKDAWSLGL